MQRVYLLVNSGPRTSPLEPLHVYAKSSFFGLQAVPSPLLRVAVVFADLVQIYSVDELTEQIFEVSLNSISSPSVRRIARYARHSAPGKLSLKVVQDWYQRSPDRDRH